MFEKEPTQAETKPETRLQKLMAGIPRRVLTGLFVFVGHNVNNAVLKDENGDFICEMNNCGQVIVDLRMRTSLEGLFAAGDIRIEAPKQVVSAAGDGSVAALQVISYIQEQQ